MTEALSLLYMFAINFAFLMLCATGLIIILGMMNIINLAHGQLMMIGAYIATIAYNHGGIPFPFAVVLSFVGVGLFGALLEKFIIRRFYGRELGALVVTWGIGLILSQGALLVFGPYMPPIPVPKASYQHGDITFSFYWLFLITMSILLVLGLWWIYLHTRFGMVSRATMQNPRMARSLGVNTGKVYSLTFSIGAALAGLCGALFSPLSSIAPSMGDQWVVPAFITVVIGGPANVIAGVAGSSFFLSMVQTPAAFYLGSFLGTVAMLFASLIIIRILPSGISGFFQRMRERT
ncbi:MAG: branched-chain amino acid ABC transporter permease [Deltaproteobacteria bacterium]|nr:branched-chain amino acid ABC transporter permease [Deltaproteobacteria bacterium]